MRAYLLLFCFPLPFSLSAYPEGAGDPVQELPPMEVESRPILFSFETAEFGDVVSNLGRNEWTKSGAADLATALAHVPGVTISRYNPVGSFGGRDGGAVFIRGHGSARPGSDLTILTDGIPRFVGIWSHPLLDLYPVEFSESIRVYKSPQPVRVGNMAFAAIDLLPRSLEGTGTRLETKLELAEWNGFRTVGLLTGGPEQLRYRAGFSHRRSDGHRPDADGEVTAGTLGLRIPLGKAHRISLHTEASRSIASDPEAVGSAPLPLVERYKTRDRFGYLKYDYARNGTSLTLKLFMEDALADWTQFHQPPPPPFPAQQLVTTTDFRNWGAQAEFATRLTDQLAFEAGVDFLDFGGSVTEAYALAGPVRFPEDFQQRLSAWALGKWTILEEGDRFVRFTAGLRKAWQDPAENVLTGQAGAEWQPGRRHLVFANVARAANAIAPYAGIFAEKWGLDLDPGGLDNEILDHVEIGYRWQDERFQFLVTVFHDEADHLFRLSPPPIPGIFNEDGFSQVGVESNLQVMVSDHLRLYAGITYVDPDRPRPDNPEWSATGAVEWTFLEDWEMQWMHQYLDDRFTQGIRFDEPLREVDASYVSSLHLHYEPAFLRAYDGRISLHVENLFNSGYAYRPGYPMPGRNFRLALQLSL